MDHFYLSNALLEAADNQRCVNNFTCQHTCIPQGSIILTILSSFGSVVGSLLIIGTFLGWKDLRTVARMILVFLATADLFTGIGYMFGAAIYLQYQSPSSYCRSNGSTTYNNFSTTYNDLCTAQSFFTTLMPMASFLWTANLSIYLFFAVGLQKINFAKKLMIPFHLTAWGIPLVTCIVLLSLHKFGTSGLQSSGAWCWINFKDGDKDYKKYLIMEFSAGKMWEIAVCILSLILCLAIKVLVWRRYNTEKAISLACEDNNIDRRLRATFTRVDQKLIWIPVVFLLLRVWGNIRFFISVPLLYDCPSQNHCDLLYNRWLIYLQGIGDPGQGWSNALLFVVFHHKIFQRLCPCLYLCGQWCRGACSMSRLRRKVRRNPKCGSRARRSKKVARQDAIRRAYKSERDPLTKDSVLYYAIPEDMSAQERIPPDPDTSSINTRAFASVSQ